MTGTAIAGSRLDDDTEALAASYLSRRAVPASNRASTLKETSCSGAMGWKAQGAGCYSMTHKSSESSPSLFSHPRLSTLERTQNDRTQPFSRKRFPLKGIILQHSFLWIFLFDLAPLT